MALHRRRSGALAVLTALLLALSALLVPGVAAASGGDDRGGTETTEGTPGDFALTVNGRGYNPAAGKETRLQDVVLTARSLSPAGT